MTADEIAELADLHADVRCDGRRRWSADFDPHGLAAFARAVAAHARAKALEEAAQMVRNYCEQTKNMVARGCLASVAYDIRARAAEGGER